MKFDDRFLKGIRRGEITASARRARTPSATVHAGRSYVVERWREEPRDEYGDPLKIRNGPHAGESIRAIWQATDVRIMVTAVEPGLLHQLADHEAPDHGFESAFELFDWWFENHGEGPGHRNGRFPELHVEIPIWVVRFTIDISHRSRLLATHSQFGYTTDPREALPDEPEAVDKATLKVYAEEAREGDADRATKRNDRWEKLTAAEKVAALEGAAASGMDVHRAIARVHQAADAARKRLQRRAA